MYKLAQKDDAAKVKQCHLMPCRIEFDKSTTNAPEYFWPTVKEIREGGDEEQGREDQDQVKQSGHKSKSESTTLTASFRGKPLLGRKVKVPEGFKGQVIGDSKDDTRSFDEFYYWNWDELPSDNDHVIKSLQWLKLAKAIHET